METTTLGRPHARRSAVTLAACFLYFDLSFMLWVLLGARATTAAE